MSTMDVFKKLREFKDSSTQLDSEQKNAVYAKEDKVLVVSGAGSGKTRVLTERVKYLLNSGVEPQSIVAITFTNLAAEEMRIRLKAVKYIGDAFIGTIHSFANKVMKNSGREYTLLNDDIDIQYHGELIQDYCSFLKFKKWLHYKDIHDQVEMGLLPEKSLEGLLSPSEQAELNIIEGCATVIPEGKTLEDYPETIQSLCSKRGVIDFQELLEMAIQYFEENNIQVSNLLVDEVQDIGTLEYNFITSLKASTMFLVGDDWQSIYGFKGGNVNIMKSLYSNQEWAKYTISTNYRTHPSILRLADKIIHQVKDIIPKEVKYSLPELEDGEPDVFSKSLVDVVLEGLKEEENLKEWFFLVRSNKELVYISNLMNDYGIPHTVFKREGLSLADLNELMEDNTVKLLTVHTSKGLEADNVVLYGNFPINTPPYLQNDEERKVMYVGVTRARKYLCILN